MEQKILASNKDEAIPHLLFKTSDYDKFSLVAENRLLQEPHVQRLIRSLATKNILEFYPVLVNNKFQILDGQHRYAAARRMGIPVYYHIIDEDLSLRTIQLLNANSQTWKFEDYLESYVKQGLPDYIELLNFAKEYKFSDSLSFRLLSRSDSHSRTSYEAFRQGIWKVTNRDEAHVLAHAIERILPYLGDGVAGHREFIFALKIALKDTTVESIISRLEAKGNNYIIFRQRTKSEYLRALGVADEQNSPSA